MEVSRSFLVELIIRPWPLTGRPAFSPLEVLLVESVCPAVLSVLPAGHQAGQGDATPGCVGDVGAAWKYSGQASAGIN